MDDTGLREEITLELPGAAMIAIHDLAAGPDGAIVVAGHGVNDTPRFAPFLAVISPDRKRQTVTQLWPYFPEIVAVARGG